MMESNRVNVGIVGLGFGAEFIPIYQKHSNANVYAICRRNEEELNKIGDSFGIEKRFTKYEELINDPSIDFIHINSPIPDHGWMSIAALKAGKHVMCTVPMATTKEECEEIVGLVKETGLKYMMAETVREEQRRPSRLTVPTGLIIKPRFRLMVSVPRRKH